MDIPARFIRIAVVCVSCIPILLTANIVGAGARVTTAELPPDVITAVRLSDEASGAGRPVSFGLPIGEGVLANGQNLVVTTETGTVLDSQWSPLASWRTDGSVLHGIMTFLTPNSAGNDGVYYIRESGSAPAAGAISKSDIVTAGFDAAVEVRLGNSVYSLSAKDLLAGIINPRLDYVHFTGPIASEFVVGGPLRLGGSGAAHETLQAYFYIRAFKAPVESVYVTLVLENTGAFNFLNDIVADSVVLRVGQEVLPSFPKAPFTVHADIRYPKRAWWNGANDLWVQHDLEYVSQTKLMPSYRPVSMSPSRLEGYPQASEWNERRILSSTNLEGGGAKPEIAPYDTWTAAYMVSGDKRAWNAMRAALDEYSMMVSNLSPGVVHARDEETGLPIDLTKKGVVGRVWYGSGGTDVLNASRDGRPVAQTDIAHWPSIGYLPYLLTGESNEMENVQHSAIQTWLNEAPGGHKGTIPGRTVRWLQVRGMGWALREIINGAVVTPDHHPLRYALQTSATYALEEYSKAAQAKDPNGEVGLWLLGLALAYENNTGLAPWMDDYVTWAVGSAFERGWKQELQENGFWRWKAQGVVGRLGTSVADGFCWEFAARYSLEMRPNSDEAPYASWNEIFRANHPDVASCAAPGTSTIGGGDRNGVDYGAQMAGGLAIAASTNIPGAAAAWDIYDSRQKSWSFGFERGPEWAIKPRVPAVRPESPLNLFAE